MLQILEILAKASGPALVIITVMIGVFVLYVGVTLGVTLFHRDEATRRHAASVLRQLLKIFTRQG